MTSDGFVKDGAPVIDCNGIRGVIDTSAAATGGAIVTSMREVLVRFRQGAAVLVDCEQLLPLEDGAYLYTGSLDVARLRARENRGNVPER